MFWDASALVPVLLAEQRSRELSVLLGRDGAAAIWWASPVECTSAIYRRYRESVVTASQRDEGLERLRKIIPALRVLPATEKLREQASRLLSHHPLRGADALQLSAALIWCEGEPQGQGFVCLDRRLGEFAEQEGFRVLPAA